MAGTLLVESDSAIVLGKTSVTAWNNLSFVLFSVGCALGVMVIVVGNRHDDTSSNPGRDWLHFT